MKQVTLGLGSNIGDRRGHLREALALLQEVLPLAELKISPVYESPALLPEKADSLWNKPFLNLVVQGVCDQEPLWLLQKTKEIEKQLGRGEHQRWAPRAIDIDILLWESVSLTSDSLTIPHPEMYNRHFVLDPLKDLDPQFRLAARKQPLHSPLWMGILNVTPDSFSDGGQYLKLEQIDSYLNEIEEQVGIIDIGAESTRPGATPLTSTEEWDRLESVLKHLRMRYAGILLRPLLSVDTRHGDVAARALELGVDMINDVGGLSDPEMLLVLKRSRCQYVLMHSLSVPADPKTVLSRDKRASVEVKDWFAKKMEQLTLNGISLDRVIVDPGVGFGKDHLQSLDILRHIEVFQSTPCRLLVGHSRKSFIKDFAGGAPYQRDLESIGVSLNLARRGVDILRVHNPVQHIRAFHGFNHVSGGAGA